MTVEILKNTRKPLCVLGVLDTEKGNAIAKDMLEWLCPLFTVHVVRHDGSLFEQPALRYMQELCKKTNRPCLYLHTRGAVHEHKTTVHTHEMWRQEFRHIDEYMAMVKGSKPQVVCPLSGPNGETWYNGFVANAAAMRAIPDIEPNDDRYFFEWRMFKDVPVYGVLQDKVSIDAARAFVMQRYRQYPKTVTPEGVDIVYIVGRGSKWQDNELRFSLRSLCKYGKNIRRIILVGHCPAWLDRSKITYVPADDKENCKHINIMQKVKKAIDTLHLTEPFLISSDDHWYTKPTDFAQYPIISKGKIRFNPEPDGEYQRSMQQTRRWLHEHNLPVYKTNPHYNTWIDPEVFAQLYPELIEAWKSGKAPDGIEMNCAMGNTRIAAGVPFVSMQDGKCDAPKPMPWWKTLMKERHCVSVGERSMTPHLMMLILKTYPDQSPYELSGITYQKLISPHS